MFYEYLKNAYSVIQNYTPLSSDLTEFLDANKFFIDSIKNRKLFSDNPKFDSYTYIQNAGGVNYDTIKKAFDKYYASIFQLLDNLNQSSKMEEFMEAFTILKKVIAYLIQYITHLASLIDDKKLGEMQDQLKSVNDILSKYADNKRDSI